VTVGVSVLSFLDVLLELFEDLVKDGAGENVGVPSKCFLDFAVFTLLFFSSFDLEDLLWLDFDDVEGDGACDMAGLFSRSFLDLLFCALLFSFNLSDMLFDTSLPVFIDCFDFLTLLFNDFDVVIRDGGYVI